MSQLKKYGNPKARSILHEQNIQLFGRQILEVSYLVLLTPSLPEYLMEFCKVTLTFESADEIL